ncbi:unnamed protein product [Eruca vesicaria subsp. sativa]|uniref:DNA replication factor Cdt1 C-terminal domain-containing protein n=1 Tax=Eruca vesicaria subsp. sativa TaxID=29727 RepID=A0ABC8M5C1_ERUVS|nr:unnamed protein product [Eruca vesicaria subsp. sativa]
MKVPSTLVKADSNSANIAPTASPARPSLSKINLAPTPVKAVSTTTSVPSMPVKIDLAPAIVASTPPDFASTPVRLFSASLAAARLQKRSSKDTSQDDVNTDRPFKLARRSTLSLLRSLNFDSYTEDEKAMDVTDDDEDIDQVPVEDASTGSETECSSSPGKFTGGPSIKQHHGMSSSQSNHVRNTLVLNIHVSSLRGGPKSVESKEEHIEEQERKAIESNPAISEAKRRRKMMACLHKLFNVIHYLIQSIRHWVITKEELVCTRLSLAILILPTEASLL